MNSNQQRKYVKSLLIRLLSLSVYMKNKSGSAENKVKSL